MMTPLRVRKVAVLVVCLSLIASGLYWWQLSNAGNQLRSETIAQAELRARQLNGAVADQVALLIRYVDFAALELAEAYTSGNAASFSSQAHKIEQRFPAQSLLQIGVIDAGGYLVYSNLEFRGRVFLGDRAHFTAHVGSVKPRLFVSAPVLGRVSKQWSIQFSRPIQRDGRFDGVIVISLSPDYLYRTLAALSLASDDSISIFREGGEYLARNVDHESALGKSVGPNRAFVGPDAAPSGAFQSVANFDQVRRLYHWQRLDVAPVIVVTGLSEATLLKPVNELLGKNRWQAALATVILWLFTLGAVALLLRLSVQQKLVIERAEQIRADEARLRAIYDVLPVGISLTDRQGSVIDCNPASEKLLCIPRSEQLAFGLDSRNWKLFRADGSVMPGEEYPAVRALQTGVAVRDVEMRLATAHGDVWLQVSAMPINANEFGVVVAYADITARKLVEEQLRESESRFRTLFEKNSSAMLLIEPSSGKIVDANAAAAAFYGYSVERLTCMAISDINALPPGRVAEQDPMDLRADHDHCVFSHRLADGEVRTVEVHSTPIAVAERTLLVSIIYDVTQRVHDDLRIDSLMREQKAILDSHILGIVKVRNRTFVWTNAAFAAMLGYAADGLTGLPTRVIYPGDQAYVAFGEAAYVVIRKGEIFRTEVQYQRKDASLGWFEISGGLIAAGSDESIWALVDITERKRSEAALQRSEEFKNVILNSVPAEIAVVDSEGVILAVNRHWRRFAEENGLRLGVPAPRTDVESNYLSVCQSGPNSTFDGALEAGAGIQAVLDGRLPSYSQDYPCHSPQQERWFTMTVMPLGQAARDGAVITHIDITERKQMENQVRDLAFHDPLTQLPNRRLLNDRLRQAMAASKRSGIHGALMFLDLDNFKQLNDSHGHEVGDLLLIEAADRLKRCMREMDTVARFGGDEFVVMISELNSDPAESAVQAGIIAEKIRLSLARPYFLSIKHEAHCASTVEHHCTASIGVALFIDHEARQDDILKWADTAMYEAKTAGRNSIRFHAATTEDLRAVVGA